MLSYFEPNYLYVIRVISQGCCRSCSLVHYEVFKIFEFLRKQFPKKDQIRRFKHSATSCKSLVNSILMTKFNENYMCLPLVVDHMRLNNAPYNRKIIFLLLLTLFRLIFLLSVAINNGMDIATCGSCSIISLNR